MPEWISLTKQLPKEFEAVLVHRAGDLYPVVAFAVYQGGKIYWWTEREGPEDCNEHLIRSLVVEPTHWVPLPRTLEKDQAIMEARD